MAFDRPAQAEPVPQPPPNPIYRVFFAELSECGIRLSSFEFFPLELLVLLYLAKPWPADPFRALGRVVWAEQLGHEERGRTSDGLAEPSDEPPRGCAN